MSSADGEVAQMDLQSSSDIPDELAISVSSVTGHKWTQPITRYETVNSLKEKIWQRTGLYPYHQGLIHGNVSLSNFSGETLLRDFGIQNNSVVWLAVVTRAGPLSVPLPDKLASTACSSKCDIISSECSSNKPKNQRCGLRIFGGEHLDENCRTLHKMCELRRQMRQNNATSKFSLNYEKQLFSATEDTSAKESSANDTECDDDKSCTCLAVAPSTKQFESLYIGRNANSKRARQNAAKEEASSACQSRVVSSTPRDRLLAIMQPRVSPPSTDVNTHSEDGSELSSGVVICDLSNEFRRLRVRRKHHGLSSNANSVQRVRARSKPRQPPVTVAHQYQGSDITSSDDERPCRRFSEAGGLTYATLRRSSASSRAQKIINSYQSHQRCNACAVKLNNLSVAFQCRCGKTLCARHRATGMHTCTRIRKLQDVSD